MLVHNPIVKFAAFANLEQAAVHICIAACKPHIKVSLKIPLATTGGIFILNLILTILSF